MVCSYTEVPKEFVVFIFQYALRDVIVPFIISVEPAFSRQIPVDCPGHIIMSFRVLFLCQFWAAADDVTNSFISVSAHST